MSELPPIVTVGSINPDSSKAQTGKKKGRSPHDGDIKSPDVAKHPKESSPSGEPVVEIDSK